MNRDACGEFSDPAAVARRTGRRAFFSRRRKTLFAREKNFFRKWILTNLFIFAMIPLAGIDAAPHAGVAQSVEQLICNQQVGGSSPSTSSSPSLGHK